jgi:hypothetical protein
VVVLGLRAERKRPQIPCGSPSLPSAASALAWFFDSDAEVRVRRLGFSSPSAASAFVVRERFGLSSPSAASAFLARVRFGLGSSASAASAFFARVRRFGFSSSAA